MAAPRRGVAAASILDIVDAYVEYTTIHYILAAMVVTFVVGNKVVAVIDVVAVVAVVFVVAVVVMIVAVVAVVFVVAAAAVAVAVAVTG